MKSYEFPSLLWHFFHVHDGFHEGHVTYRDFWDPDCAQQMRPFQGIGLLESAFGIWAKYASLSISLALCFLLLN